MNCSDGQSELGLALEMGIADTKPMTLLAAVIADRIAMN